MRNTCICRVVADDRPIAIGYKLKKKRLIEDLILNGLNMKILDHVNAHQILS